MKACRINQHDRLANLRSKTGHMMPLANAVARFGSLLLSVNCSRNNDRSGQEGRKGIGRGRGFSSVHDCIYSEWLEVQIMGIFSGV